MPRRAVLSSVLLLAACTPEQPPATPPPPVEPPPAASASAAPAASGSAYSGHGISSVSPEILAKYAPTPLPSEVTRHIQALLDIRAPSPGQLSPDGKTLYFSWTITGVRQLFRIDGPQRFPLQMTGGEDATNLAEISPDGRWLILTRDRKGEENPGIYVQHREGGPLAEIQHKAGVQSFPAFVSDDSSYLYYRANDIKNDSYAIY